MVPSDFTQHSFTGGLLTSLAPADEVGRVTPWAGHCGQGHRGFPCVHTCTHRCSAGAREFKIRLNGKYLEDIYEYK